MRTRCILLPVPATIGAHPAEATPVVDLVPASRIGASLLSDEDLFDMTAALRSGYGLTRLVTRLAGSRRTCRDVS